MTNFKPELIIFDLDGTLVDSSPDIVAAINKMLAAIGQAPYPEQQVRQWMGNGASMLVMRALTGQLKPDEQPENLAEAMTLFSDFYSAQVCVHSCLYAGVTEGLNQLQAAHIKLACVTNKPARFTLPLLTAIGLKDYFQFVASGDSFAAMKPDPLPLQEAMKVFALNAKQVLMVGDSVNDIQAGKRAGVKTALVSYGYLGQATPDELGADYNIESIEQLAGLFGV